MEQFTFVIRAHDKRGAPIPNGGEDVKVAIKGPVGPVQLKLEDRGNGQYVCIYNAREAGLYQYDILVNGQHLQGSPFTQKLA